MNMEDEMRALGIDLVHPKLAQELIAQDEARDREKDGQAKLTEFIIAFKRLGIAYANDEAPDWLRLINARKELPEVVMRAAGKFKFNDFYDEITDENSREFARVKVDNLIEAIQVFFIDGECSRENYSLEIMGDSADAFIEALIQGGGLQDVDFTEGDGWTVYDE